MHNRSSRLRLLVAACAGNLIANLSWWLQPEIVHDVIVKFHSSESAAGFVVTAEFASIAFCSLLLARFLPNARYVSVAAGGAFIALLGSLASLFADDYAWLLVGRSITGIGEGAALMVATASVAHFADPDKAYAKLNLTNILVGAAITFVLPAAAWQGRSAAFSALLIGLTTCGFFFLAIPPSLRLESAPAALNSTGVRGHRRSVYVIPLAFFLVAVAGAAMWGFYFVLGLRASLSEQDVIDALGLAVLAAIPAGLLSNLIGTRFGRLRALVVALVIYTGAVMLLTLSSSPLGYRVGTITTLACVNFMVPYFYGYAAANDPSGRGPAITGAAFLMTGAVGPYIGGLLMESFGTSSIAVFVLVSNVLAVMILCRVDRQLNIRDRESAAVSALESSLRSL